MRNECMYPPPFSRLPRWAWALSQLLLGCVSSSVIYRVELEAGVALVDAELWLPCPSREGHKEASGVARSSLADARGARIVPAE